MAWEGEAIGPVSPDTGQNRWKFADGVCREREQAAPDPIPEQCLSVRPEFRLARMGGICPWPDSVMPGFRLPIPDLQFL